MTFRLLKRNGRLIIEDEDGNLIYSPPDWLRPRIHGRKDMTDLAKELSTSDNLIKPIIAFETRLRP